LEIDVQYAVDKTDIEDDQIPDVSQFRKWASAALGGRMDDAQLSVRIVDEPEISELNARYRNKTGPTNVLSFPAEFPADIPLPLIGDVIICAPIVRKEALEQHKDVTSHWAHMTIHGVLHLLGYDHEDDAAASTMEAAETGILASLGFDNPYKPDFHTQEARPTKQ
jgi:probable rRNA maturation factor